MADESSTALTGKSLNSPSTYCVYILACADDSFYTGMTVDLPRRLAEHRAGRGARWTAQRRPVELVFTLDGLDYRSAREVEQYIKSQSRARKQALVERDPRMLALVRKRV
jgi:predicted GIY-YIG superfamily endonuclease